MNQGGPDYAHPLNGTTHSDEEDGSSSDHDSSSSVCSMSSNEIENHFVESHNRRFQSLGYGRRGPYPFPVDGLENQRLGRVHELVKELLEGRNYRGPVQQTLAVREDSRTVRILDIGTGSGKWVEEMAEEFPHTKVYGLDIGMLPAMHETTPIHIDALVPLSTRYPADNVQFEVHDINTRTRWAQGRFDFVHMRQLCFSLVHLPTVMREISRILRHQGLFLACEWIPGIFRMNGTNVVPLTGPSAEIFTRLRNFSARQSLFCDPLRIPGVLTESPTFENVVTERHLVPLDDTALGRRAKRSLHDFANASRYYLFDAGLAGTEIERYVTDLRDGIDGDAGVCLIYLTVHARRKTV